MMPICACVRHSLTPCVLWQRAIVWNEKSLVRLWDVCYDGYNGGKDCQHVKWHDDNAVEQFKASTYEINRPYEGVSMMVMAFTNVTQTPVWPSPVVFFDGGTTSSIALDGEHAHRVDITSLRVFHRDEYKADYTKYFQKMPNFQKMHNSKSGGYAAQENETSCCCGLAFQGTHKVFANGLPVYEVTGNGHHGADYVGAASVRNGKGLRPPADSITNARLLA